MLFSSTLSAWVSLMYQENGTVLCACSGVDHVQCYHSECGWIRCSCYIFYCCILSGWKEQQCCKLKTPLQDAEHKKSKANIPNGFLKTVLSVLSDVYCCQVRLPLCSTSAHLPLSVFGSSEMLGSWHSPAWVHQHLPAEIPAARLLS